MKNALSRQDQEDIQSFIRICRNVLGDSLVSVILFGSAARGDQNQWSDIDFCVVTNRNREKDKLGIMRQFNRNCDVIMRCDYNFENYVKNLNALDLEIFQDGIVVYGIDILKRKKKVFEGIKREYGLVHNRDLGKGVWEVGVAG